MLICCRKLSYSGGHLRVLTSFLNCANKKRGKLFSQKYSHHNLNKHLENNEFKKYFSIASFETIQQLMLFSVGELLLINPQRANRNTKAS